ncbi:unnamed protein product [Boreogadus saida]
MIITHMGRAMALTGGVVHSANTPPPMSFSMAMNTMRRGSLSLLEVELVELKERLNNSSQQQQQQQQQQLEEQRSLLGAEFRASLLELRGEQLSYAQALQRPGSSNNADLGEITQLLHLICTKLMGQVV